METKIIARVNNVDIVATSDEQLIPIRPICDALGIDFARQRKKIQEDEDLSSVGVLTPSTGSVMGSSTRCFAYLFVTSSDGSLQSILKM